MRITGLALPVAAAALLVSSNAQAFHDGGVAYCDGCHTMHNSEKGTVMNKGQPLYQGVKYLLKGTDQSSTCLNCHAGNKSSAYIIMANPAPAAGLTTGMRYTPGGDFAWLKKSFSGTNSRGSAVSSPGDRHGHNVVAADFSLAADATLATGPGGTYAAANLTCVSCHDPHARARVVDTAGTIEYVSLTNSGNKKTLTKPIGTYGSYGAQPTADYAVGVYRLLGGIEYKPVSYAGAPAFNADPPIAMVPSSYNQKESTTQLRVAYGKGMSEWCANCHASIHNNTADAQAGKLIHPTGPLATLGQTGNVGGEAATFQAIYNAYKKSGDMTGTVADSFDSLVPFEENSGDLTVLNTRMTTDATKGPQSGNENVMCLSCHRAHASGFDSMTRWDNKSTYLVVDHEWPGSDKAGEPGYGEFHLGRTSAETRAAMYDREPTKYAYFQRSLCNKCHAKD